MHLRQVEAAIGAEPIVGYCGGLQAILAALSMPPIAVALADDHVVFKLQHYAVVKRVLQSSMERGGWKSLEPYSLIPDCTLKSIRSGAEAEGPGAAEQHSHCTALAHH